MRKKTAKTKPTKQNAQPVYADAEFPHLTEDQADIMVALERLNDDEIPFDDFLRSEGYVVVGNKVQKRI